MTAIEALILGLSSRASAHSAQRPEECGLVVDAGDSRR